MKHRGRDFLLQHCPALHIELRGLAPSQAILQFIKEANSLEDGAVTFYRMRKVSHVEKWICSIIMSVFWSVVLYIGEKRAEMFLPSWCGTKRSLCLSGIPSKSTVLSPVPHLICFINVYVIFERRWRGGSFCCMIFCGLISTASPSRFVQKTTHRVGPCLCYFRSLHCSFITLYNIQKQATDFHLQC